MAAAVLENYKNRDISATVWPIFTRFDTVMQNMPLKFLKKLLRYHVNYITTSPRELMCKIWLESIRPLRTCACVKKHVLCGFFN